MANELVLAKNTEAQEYLNAHEQFLEVRIGSQLFGVPVVRVRDVLKPLRTTRIPLSRPEILGFMNLRGRIVTVIDMRTRLSVTEEQKDEKQMFVVVEVDDELYSLKVDSVGDTKTMAISAFEKNPENMLVQWKDISRGIFKLDKELMLVLDVSNVIKF